MTRDPIATPSDPADRDDPVSHRRERMMAFHLDAMEEPERLLIHGRLASDPDWRKASEDAQAMLAALRDNGADEIQIPRNLAEQTLKLLAENGPSSSEAKRAAPAVATERRAPVPMTPVSPLRFGRWVAAVLLLSALPVAWMGLRYSMGIRSAPTIVWETEPELAAGGSFAPVLVVRDASSRAPLAGAKLRATLIPKSKSGSTLVLGETETDDSGMFQGSWPVPAAASGQYQLVVEAMRGTSVVDRALREVTVKRSATLVLSPDRLQARPGETIRVRAFLADAIGEKPVAGQNVVLELRDPNDNRIAREEKTTSAFGLVWTEFPLDSEAIEGSYTLRAEGAGLISQRMVSVKSYVLPAFEIVLTPVRPWFGVKDPIRVALKARTFDGHPIAKARGPARLVSPSGRVLREIEALTDDAGVAKLEWPSAASLYKMDVDVDDLRVTVSLTDPGQRIVAAEATVPIAQAPVLLTVLPEAGELIPDLPNDVYVMANSPDRAPARVHLRITGAGGLGTPIEADTDEHGVAVFPWSGAKAPGEVVRIQINETPAKLYTLPVRSGSAPGFLLRTDHAVSQIAERILVNVLTGPGPLADKTVLLAIRKEGRTLCTSSLPLSGGKGQLYMVVPMDARGVISIEASIPDSPLTKTERRMVAVNGGGEIRVVASLDRPLYRPGDAAKLECRVTDFSGRGMPGAVSVVAVDEALMALTGDHPGLAQALQAAGAAVFKQPDSPLEPTAFSSEKGFSLGAHAALASVRPLTPDGARKYLGELVQAKRLSPETASVIEKSILASQNRPANERRERDIAKLRLEGHGELVDAMLAAASERTVIDNGTNKLAELRQERKEIAGTLGKLSTLWIGMVILLLAAAIFGRGGVRQTQESIELGIPATMLLLGVLAPILSYVDSRSPATLPLLAFVMAGSHVLLMLQAQRYSAPGTYEFKTASLILDVIVIGLAFANSPVVLFAAAVVAAVLQWVNICPSTHHKTGGAFLGVGVLAGLLMITSLVLNKSAGQAKSERKSEWKSEVVFDAAAPAARFSPDRGMPTNEMPSPMEVIGERQSLTAFDSTSGASPALRLRWDFRETLVFAPQVVTDENGLATLDIPVTDSLTRWRVKVDAIRGGGGTAWTTQALNVTQPFSVDVSLPTDVTAGDRLYLPVVVSNHSDVPKDVALNIEAAGARFEGAPQRTLSVPAKSVAPVMVEFHFPTAGDAQIRITAKAGDDSDAVQRALTILPVGKPEGFAAGRNVRDNAEFEVRVPEGATPDSIRAQLRLHRGSLTQMIEGLDGMLREPNGCFEQTSSAAYPNVMILRYLRANGTPAPAIEERARRFIASGYQRLLGFEVKSQRGGFSLYGQAPASPWLTAYGLLQFNDMAEVHPVDPALLTRMREYLRSRMQSDGSYAVEHSAHHGPFESTAITAYVVMAMGEHAPAASIRYLRQMSAESQNDPYLCSLVALALAGADPAAAAQFAPTIRNLAKPNAATGSLSLNATRTQAWGYGNSATVEASALGALALLATGTEFATSQQLLTGLQERTSPGGGWGSTHATVIALKALEKGVGAPKSDTPVRVLVHLNGNPLPPIEMPAESTATPTGIPLLLQPGVSRVRVQVSGGAVSARVSGDCRVPWASGRENSTCPIQGRITYSSTTVERGATVLGRLSVRAVDRVAEVPMVEWGLPAGFAPDTDDLARLKAQGELARYEIAGRKLRLYMPEHGLNKLREFSVRFTANIRGTVTSEAGRMYEYYRAEEARAIPPVTFEVK